jgi:DNA-binding IclR family transcriptional regulator
VRRDKSNSIIQSVAHALDVLEEFRGETDELGVTELSKKLKLHKNNVFRILATLQSRNYIEQNRSNDNYKLGIKCLELGQTFIHQRGLLKQAKVVLKELAETTGETSYLSFLRATRSSISTRSRGPPPSASSPRRAAHPLHASAAGKALIAFESDEELAKRFSGELKRFTKNTKTALADLIADLQNVRKLGYATDLEEFEDGLRCLAAPIRDYTRKVIGALSVSGPAHRISEERIEGLIAGEVLRHAQALSGRLGYRE